ncbi:MAG TPA: gluconate 2-dehydrogenase subunit 3 family protein [Acidimicrobiales bacterium]|nr:gluconate 2-dehydrogenase subunit 3 family protein [Acidimicrobiales bacterium]
MHGDRCYGDADVSDGGGGDSALFVLDPRPGLMPRWLTDVEFAVLGAACDRLIPEDDTPGASSAGVPDYIDGLLGAFLSDPPRIWAGGPTSGRHGGEAAFGRFHRLSRLDELAWRTRIEGSRGMAEREFNGPVRGLQERYRTGLAELGEDFCDLSPDEQDERLRRARAFTALLYEHCCEGMYGAPEYGGNRDTVGWQAIGYPGDVQPRGFSDAEVSGP